MKYQSLLKTIIALSIKLIIILVPKFEQVHLTIGPDKSSYQVNIFLISP